MLLFARAKSVPSQKPSLVPTAQPFSVCVGEVWSALLLVLGGVGISPSVFHWILMVMHLEKRLNLSSLSHRVTQKTFYGLYAS